MLIVVCLSLEAGIITLKCDIIKGGVEKFALKQPIFVPGPVSRRVCLPVQDKVADSVPGGIDGPDVLAKVGV